jgi:hypothetical protein
LKILLVLIETFTCCRGGNGKCYLAILDLVLLHNKATEGQAKNDPIGLDVFEKIADLKTSISQAPQGPPSRIKNSDFAPQSEAARQNFKTLLELELSLLMGCNIQWEEPSNFAAPAAAATSVLSAAAAADDNDDSAEEGGSGGEGGGGGAAAGPAQGVPAETLLVNTIASLLSMFPTS